MSFELADVYAAEYDEAVKEYFPPFPRGLASKYYEEGGHDAEHVPGGALH